MRPDRIRILRENANLSQKELADALFTSQQSVGKWEKAITKPSPDMLISIAKYFGVTSDYLLGLSDVPFSSSEKANSVFPLSDNEERIILDYRKLNKEGQSLVRQQISLALMAYSGKNNAVSDMEKVE